MEMVFHKEETESSVIYENFNDASAKDAASQSRSGADSKVRATVPVAQDVKKSSCRAATVFLGLTCLLLLIGLMTLVSRFSRIKSEQEKATALLRTSYNSVTEEKNQLQTSYNNVTEEKNQLQTSYNNVTEEKNQLQTSYNNLTEEKKQLQTSYNNLTEEKKQLQTSYNNLTEEKKQLQTSYNNLTEEKKQLQTSYNNLTEEKNQLQTSYNNLTEENVLLQERYEALTDDRNNLHRKLQDIEASYKSLTEQSDNLKRILNAFGWMHFGGSSYYISSVEKTWQNSREDCRRKGADLIIINSKEEQIFINQFKRPVWIGLTDSQTDGRWKWVDGTPMTKSYWGSGEPNGGQSENCVETKYFNDENSWNDAGCSASHTWICEKKVLL